MENSISTNKYNEILREIIEEVKKILHTIHPIKTNPFEEISKITSCKSRIACFCFFTDKKT